MAGKTTVSAQSAHKGLSRSADRDEAHRARSILPTLAGCTAARIAQAFGVREDTVHQWHSDFMKGGVEALRAGTAPGPEPVKTQPALRVATPLFETPPADWTNWTLARLAREVERSEGVAISRRSCRRRLKKGLRLEKAAAHADGAAGCGRRGEIRPAAQAFQATGKAGDITLLFADESEALTHRYFTRAGDRCGADLRVSARVRQKRWP